MPPPSVQPIQFKFRWLDQQGNEVGMARKRGRFDGRLLVLDDTEVPVDVVTAVEVLENRMVFSAIDADGRQVLMAIAIPPTAAQQLKSGLDIARSATWARLHREQLAEQGRAHAYRAERCPQCGATLVLTDMPKSPQLYCHFCNTLATVDSPAPPPAGEKHLRLCDECGMFSRPRKFTIFYFYFLLVVAGWRERKTWRCPACMRGDAWKMFFGNLPFALGVPVAVTQLARSYGGSITGPYAGLDRANLKARRGDLIGALDGYRAILERVPHSAGVKYNLGRALWMQGHTARAAETFRLALEDCSNYGPACHALASCYQQLGETEKLKELQRIWGDDEADDQQSTGDAERAAGPLTV